MLFEIKGLTKNFGGLTAVNDLNLQMEKNELVGLIGPNGAGKTTVFNLVTGIYQPTAGTVRLEEKDITGLPPHEIGRLGIARTFQNLRLFRGLSVIQNVTTATQLQYDYGFISVLFRAPIFRKQEREIRDKAMEYLDMVGLADQWNSKAGSLPYGLQRKLEIARALALSPKLLLLDEPAAGMNPDESLDLMDMIQGLRKQLDLTILVIEHHMELVMGICERIVVLNFGATIATGTPAEIQANPEVITAYLGEDTDEFDDYDDEPSGTGASQGVVSQAVVYGADVFRDGVAQGDVSQGEVSQAEVSHAEGSQDVISQADNFQEGRRRR